MKEQPDRDRSIDADLLAFAESTARGMPTIRDTERLLRTHTQRPMASGGSFMEALHRLRRHPRVLTGLGAGVLAGLLLMPISWERTIGHTVEITLPGSAREQVADRARVARLARQVRLALHAEAVQVKAGEGGLVLSARVPSRSRAEVQRRADALLKGLAREQLPGRAQVTPRTEQVSGRVYARALDRVIEVRVDMSGKDANQIEAEIRDQLQRQGVSDAEVQVQRSGHETRVQIGAEVGDRTLRIERHTQGGAPLLEIKMGDLDTRREPGMTDDGLREKIERQLRTRGLEPQVTVHGDEIRIEARRPG